ncbi:MAG: hypothetical protein AAFU77_13495 [Myxococcota bacterium]
MGRLGICRLAHEGIPVRLALEASSSNTPFFARYLASDGSRGETERLLRSSIWGDVSGELYDGRGSLGLLRLLERIRALKAAGLDVDVYGVDRDSADPESVKSHRDFAMAFKISALAKAQPDALILGLMSTGHAQKNMQAETEIHPAWYSVGYFLRENMGTPYVTVFFEPEDGRARGAKLEYVGAKRNDYALRTVPLTNSPPAKQTYDGTVLTQWLRASRMVNREGDVE